MNYSDLSAEQQMIAETKKYVNNKALDVQSDWNESDSSAGDYIKNKPTLGTAAALDVASSGDALSSQVVKGDDSRLTDSRNAADVYSWAKTSTKPSYTASEVGAIATTEKGVANGVATLDNNGFVPSSQLPSYVDDAIEGYYYNSKFYKESTHTTEITGETEKIYIDLSTDKTYRWSGSVYVEINKSQLIQGSSTNGNIKIDGTETTVYTHPGSGTNPHGTTKSDIGLGNVDNTSDLNKPISTATQTALDGKVDKVNGKGLSTNDYTTADKNKLANIEAEANKTVVDSAMSDSSTNPLQNKVITAELQGAKTATGNPITVTDAAPVNAVNLSMDLEPVQDLHGYDHPWVGGAGKNLYIGSPSFDGYERINSWTKQTETYNGHEVYKKSGTWMGAYHTVNLPIGTYTFSAMVKVNTQATVYAFVLISGDTATVDSQSNSLIIPANTWTKITATFTVSVAGTVSPRCEIGVSDVDLYISEYQLEAGSQATSYADYENICPISGRSELPINVTPNLLVNANWKDGYYINNSGQEQYNALYKCTTSIIDVKPSTTYYVEMNYTGITELVINVAFYDANGNYISRAFATTFNTSGIHGGTVTTPANCHGVIVSLPYDSDGMYCAEGTSNQGKTYTIQLGDTVYGAHWNNKGQLVADTALAEFDGSSDEAWNRGNPTYRFYIQQSDAKVSIDGVLSNQFMSGWTDNALHVGTINNVNCIDFQFDANSSITSVEALRTYLSNNPLQVCYELATPYTIPLTPQQIKLLENTNTIYTDYEGDTITIEYQPNNAIGEAVRVVEENYETRVSLLENRNTAKVYGFHISSTESDPSAKVTYLADAVGMTPAKMNYSKGKFDYGSWENVWFVRDTKPCHLLGDGTVRLYLDKNDFSKDVDGNYSMYLFANEHVMIEFPKIWYKVVPDLDGYGASVYIAPIKIDEDYVDYPYIDYLGRHKEHFYMSAYSNSVETIDGVVHMRSRSGEFVSKSLTASEEINACKANGDGWYTEDAGSIMLINFLLILMGKSTDTQTVFGQGLHTGGTEAINDGFRAGIHNQKGMFYGTNSGTIASNSYGNAVKVFGIENYWGFQWRRYAGDILYAGHRKIKLCYGNEDGSTASLYNLTGDGYVDIGETPSGTSGGYISKMKFTKSGMYSSVSSGSSSTYYCDGQWFNNSQVNYAFRGGSSADGLRGGPFCVGLYSASGSAGWAVGVALEYK